MIAGLETFIESCVASALAKFLPELLTAIEEKVNNAIVGSVNKAAGEPVANPETPAQTK